MALWTQFVDVLREAMFAYAHATNGNLALGIMAVTFLARLALFPLALRLARAAAVHQEALHRVQPELEAVRTRFQKDPSRIAEESRRILSRAGVSVVPVAGCVGALFQAPVFLGLFSAVRQCAALGGRFMWIRDISRPDVALTLVVAAITVASMAAGPPPSAGAQNRTLMIVLPAIFTVIALWQMAAGIGLYWGVSSAVGVAQGLVLRRGLGRRTNSLY
jgi:YidC/Oxa1 family membrane protein insertase